MLCGSILWELVPKFIYFVLLTCLLYWSFSSILIQVYIDLWPVSGAITSYNLSPYPPKWKFKPLHLPHKTAFQKQALLSKRKTISAQKQAQKEQNETEEDEESFFLEQMWGEWSYNKINLYVNNIFQAYFSLSF